MKFLNKYFLHILVVIIMIAAPIVLYENQLKGFFYNKEITGVVIENKKEEIEVTESNQENIPDTTHTYYQYISEIEYELENKTYVIRHTSLKEDSYDFNVGDRVLLRYTKSKPEYAITEYSVKTSKNENGFLLGFVELLCFCYIITLIKSDKKGN